MSSARPDLPRTHPSPTPRSGSATPSGEETDLTQHAPLWIAPILRAASSQNSASISAPDKESPQLLGCHPSRARATERVEDKIPLPT